MARFLLRLLQRSTTIGGTGAPSDRWHMHNSPRYLELGRFWLPRAVFAAACAGLALAMAASLSPLFDLLTPLVGHLSGALAVSALAIYARRAPVAILTLGAVATVLAHAAVGWSRQAAMPAAQARPLTALQHAPPFRLVTLNAWHRNHELGPMLRYLEREAATWVVLTEFGPDKQHVLQELKRVYPYQVSCADVWFCSLALLSRIPFEASGRVNAGPLDPPTVWARFRIATGAEPITVVGTHVHRPSRNPERHRTQLATLTSLLRRVEGAIVVAGDFNAAAASSTLEDFMSGAGVATSACWLPSWPAWPLNLPQVALDHVMVSSELSIVRAALGPAFGSDHLPVRADIVPGRHVTVCGE